MSAQARLPWVLSLVLAGLASTHIVFASFPWIDLSVSALFFEDGRFPAATNAALEAIRYAVWDLTLAWVALGLALWTLSLVTQTRVRVPPRVWLFAWLPLVVGPGILVNFVLKEHVGRARPAHLEVFGGERSFTPAFQVTDQCSTNCSFVSGEGAGAITFALMLIVLFSNWVGPRYRAAFIGGYLPWALASPC